MAYAAALPNRFGVRERYDYFTDYLSLQGSVEVHVGMKCGIRQKKLG
jgi:hypothetical protein